ncbi:MAG TPA: hypothetical protein VGD40_10325 [Chryseosolibacter sp.]
MNYLIIMAGIIGTLTMTLFIEVVARVSGKPFRVIHILADMLRFGQEFNHGQRRRIFFLATILHYAIGVGFAFCYNFLLDSKYISSSWGDAVLFGASAGIVGILGWRLFFVVHPDPPVMNLFQYLTVIWLGHLVFACGLFLHVRFYLH